eukprot:4078713-Amphidinium_carterae.1
MQCKGHGKGSRIMQWKQERSWKGGKGRACVRACSRGPGYWLVKGLVHAAALGEADGDWASLLSTFVGPRLRNLLLEDRHTISTEMIPFFNSKNYELQV